MTDVAVIGFAQDPTVRHGEGTTSGVEMLVPIFAKVLRSTGPAPGPGDATPPPAARAGPRAPGNGETRARPHKRPRAGPGSL